jgi:hypothetical protein
MITGGPAPGSSKAATAVALLALTILTGCGTYPRLGLDPAQARQWEKTLTRREIGLSRERADKILALNPEEVSGQDVRDLLSAAPAPRIIHLHGGVAKVIPRSMSFCEFLIGMGYPAASLTNPSDGTVTFSCYESSRKIAGVIAWYYEKEGLRPMMIGHSQGGMQAVKVLHRLAGKSALSVWNPLTWKPEARCEITDPLSGRAQPVAGLVLPYASAVGAGGLTRVLPKQWNMCWPGLSLHRIPDSVEAFTGFCKEADLLGGDFLGYGSMNHYKAKSKGRAVVRNVWLPTAYVHGLIPETKHLLKSQQIKDWIDNYRPAGEPIVRLELHEQFDADASHILWAADVWYSIKKHWVLELQRWIRAKSRG